MGNSYIIKTKPDCDQCRFNWDHFIEHDFGTRETNKDDNFCFLHKERPSFCDAPLNGHSIHDYVYQKLLKNKYKNIHSIKEKIL